ncbi:immunoglobulin-like domain-containing protein, partial [Aliarcobacter butzleri]|uniref:immunoglobulin-like domain-containing protein n=1 Tax=Aliarcobacter butzleri TaxID=28197 RepID=UPI003AEA66DB
TTIAIPAGQTTGSSNAVTTPNGDDVYKDGETLNYTTEVKSGGTEYELPLNTTPVSVVVTDTDTQATVTITANPVQEGENIVFTATVDADKTPKTDLVISVKDSNGSEVTAITIPAGQA